MTEKSDIWFVYDGECPVCQMGASLYKLRESAGKLYTLDARTATEHAVIQEINAARLNLDEGMVIKYRGTLYQGREALQILARLGADTGIFNTVNNRLFKSKTLAMLCYPFMRAARNLALSIKGAGQINNLGKQPK